MTRRTFLQRTGQVLLSLGLMPLLPHAWQRAMASPIDAPIPAAYFPPGTKPPATASFKALIFTDSQCSNASYQVWHDTLAAGWARCPEAAFFADLGDLTDNGEADWQWEGFLSALAPYAAEHPFVPVMGNHECYGLDWKDCLPRRYLSTFTFPGNGVSTFHGYFYSFTYGPVEFIVLNTQMLELDGFFGKGHLLHTQLNWLKSREAKPLPWRVALMHKDILAYDEYQPGQDSAGGFSDVGRAFLPALEEAGIDLVLTGHMHTYRRRGPLHSFQPAEKGPVCIMSGPAGDQHYGVPADPLDKAAIAQPTEPNYLVLIASPNRLKIECFTLSDEKIDSIALEK